MIPVLIEIWSDFVCPFCYIGKRNLETALSRFPERDKVRVVYRSFELDPSAERDPSKTIYDRLAEKYRRDVAWAKGVCAQVTQTAREAGLTFDYERAIPANTFDAHRLAQMAAKTGRQDAAQERLMAAYFTEGKNIADRAVLVEIAAGLGLDAEATRAGLDGDAGTAEVHRDEAQAHAMGIRAVPFFYLNREVPVSGAQPVDTFLAALQTFAMIRR